MAANIDISELEMNPLEVNSIGEFIIEKTFEDPMLNSIHAVWTGIKMKEQIVFAAQLGLTGIKDATCERPNTGAQSKLTQKYFEPADIGDTLVNCQKDVDSLFKAYYTKIEEYTDKFDITGSDLEKFYIVMLEDAVMKTVWRVVWLGDTAVAAADASNPGLIDANNVKFYDQIDGLWKQIFTAVTNSKIVKSTVKLQALNAVTSSTANQVNLAAGDSVAVFEDMWAKADSRLRSDPNAQYLCTREVFENYRQYLQDKGENSSIEYTMNGFPSLKWNGVNIVNMETVWDLRLRNDFVGDTTNNVWYAPNRVILTVPANIPVGTLNENDMSDIDVWYEKKERQNYAAYGFTLDAQFLEEYMIIVAY